MCWLTSGQAFCDHRGQPGGWVGWGRGGGQRHAHNRTNQGKPQWLQEGEEKRHANKHALFAEGR
jgi:hypothetical protein